MIHGIGIDILSTIHITRGIQGVGDVYLNRVYTKKEQEASCSHSNRNVYFASRFSVKESVYKALKLTLPNIDWREIEVLDNNTGTPYVTLHGAIKTYAKEQNIRYISISFFKNRDLVVSIAVAEKNQEQMS